VLVDYCNAASAHRVLSASNVTGEGEIDVGIDQAAGGEEAGETGTDDNDPGWRTGDKCGHSPMLPCMMPPSMTTVVAVM